MPAIPRLLFCLVLAAAVTGCASTSQTGTPELNKPVPANAFDSSAPAVQNVEMDWDAESMFVTQPAKPVTGAVPAVTLRGYSFSDLGVADALSLIADQAGLTLHIEGGALSASQYGPFTVENLSGPLVDVLDRMAKAAGFYWEINGKTLSVRADGQFIVNLPPVLSEDTLAGVTNTIQFLGARDVYLDRAARTLLFSANLRGMASIQQYLEHMRETRSLLVYDTHVFQVDLSDGMNTGIQWNQLGFAPNKAGLAGGGVTGEDLLGRVGAGVHTSVLTNTANAITLSYAAPTFSITGLINFLNTQGNVKSLSSPQITMVSGSKGSLNVGKTIQYVSQVGSSTTTGVSQVTAQTSSLQTGLNIQLQGDYHDKTVFTRVTLALRDVTEWTHFSAVGTDLTLPQLMDRNMDVIVRAQPGDVTLLGGIHVDNATTTKSRGIYGWSDQTRGTRSELVLVLQARLINFVSKQKTPATPSTAL